MSKKISVTGRFFRRVPSGRNHQGKALRMFLRCMMLCCLVIGCSEKKEEMIDAAKEDTTGKPEKSVYRGTIRIGLNLPQTGPYADQGRDELRAFELALEELNRGGGIQGMRVEPVLRDTRSHPAVAAKNAEELIDRHGVVMITGGASSAVAIEVGKVCQRKKTIFMATVTHSDATTGSDASRYMFRKCTSATMDARALASILSKHYAVQTDYFFITADYTWGHSTENALVRILSGAGANILGKVLTPLGTTDFTEAIEKAAAAKPDVLVLVLFGDDLVNAIRQCSTNGLKDSAKLLVVPYIELNMALKAGPVAIQGIIASAPWYWRLSEVFQKAKLFVDAFFEQYGRMPSNCAEAAYVNIMQYAEAVERAGSFHSADVVTALEGHEFTGLKDPERWRRWDHQCIQTVFLLKGRKPEDMKNKYDFFDIVYRVAGDEIARTRAENPVAFGPLE